jgi:hypothetical protein
MCGRVIQSSGPVSYAILDGMNVRDSRVHIASTELVGAYLKALWRVKSQFDLDDHPDPHPGPRLSWRKTAWWKSGYLDLEKSCSSQ